MKQIKRLDFRKQKAVIIYVILAIMIAVLNLIAWNSTAFCDIYIAYIFPVWVNTYGRFTGLFPFSVGEWLIAAGVALVLLVVAITVLFAFAKGIFALDFPDRIKKIIYGFYCFFAWTLLAVCLIMTLNCMILYHASTFSEKYFGEDTQEYDLEDLALLYNEVAEQCNELCTQVERDENGTIVYSGSVLANGRMADMQDKAIEIMQQLGERYPQLDGYYPRPKALLSSDFMCQQYMQGYYFPFSMEANYNDVMYVMNKPSTMCHELAHLRGYIYEDEANFISYLACIQSDDIYFQYSGYLSVLNYLINDLYDAQLSNPELFAQVAERTGLQGIYSIVAQDNTFVTQEEWDRINGKALIDTETVDKASDAFVDTTLKVNGVSDGKISYSRVVRLMLQYREFEE